MQENDRLARAARASGVVVESRDTQIHKLPAHRGKMDGVRGCDKREEVRAVGRVRLGWTEKNREFALAFRDENGILSSGRIVTCVRSSRSHCLTKT